MLHPGAYVEIPELEFEIGADHRRRVDSVYNHIAASIFNLERHVEMLGEDNPRRCGETGHQGRVRTAQIGVGHGHTGDFRGDRPGGLSAFKPGEGVKVSALEADGQYDRSSRAVAVPEDEREMDKVD